MRFVGVHRAFVLGAAVDAGNEALGVWLRLMSYAGSDEVESPRLVGARTWGERRWLVACQLKPPDIALAVGASLARWDGDDLVVEGWDEDGLAAVESRRANGAKGGRPRKNPPVNRPDNLSVSQPVTGGVTGREPNANRSETPLRSDPILPDPGAPRASAPAIPDAPGPGTVPPAAPPAPAPPPPDPPAPREDPKHPRSAHGLLALFGRRWERSEGKPWFKHPLDDRRAVDLVESIREDQQDPEARELAFEQVILAIDVYLSIEKPFYAGHPFKVFVDDLPALRVGDAAALDRLRRSKPRWDAAAEKHRAAAKGTRTSEPTPVAPHGNDPRSALFLKLKTEEGKTDAEAFAEVERQYPDKKTGTGG